MFWKQARRHYQSDDAPGELAGIGTAFGLAFAKSLAAASLSTHYLPRYRNMMYSL